MKHVASGPSGRFILPGPCDEVPDAVDQMQIQFVVGPFEFMDYQKTYLTMPEKS